LPEGHLSPDYRPARFIYFDRRQIEVHHREEKDTLAVGQARSCRWPLTAPCCW
jgi:hypothetical protein